MIFVTVGSVAPFDELIEEVDRLIEKGALNGVVAQVGNGKYEPKRAKWFRFKRGLSGQYQSSDLIITHNGAGTLFELLAMKKRAIAIPNPHTNQMENLDVVQKLSRDNHILLCMDVKDLEKTLQQATSWKESPYEEQPCRIPEILTGFLLGPSKEPGR